MQQVGVSRPFCLAFKQPISCHKTHYSMPELKQKLSLSGLTMVAIGGAIGAGIFVTPYEVAQALPHGGWMLMVWVLGGLVALTGALTFAELGGMFPKAGGVYVYLREAYGPLAGFLYGWVTLLVINTGSLAALGITFAEYATFFVPLSSLGKTLLAAGVIGGLTLINIRGVQTSQALVHVFTGLKLLAIVGIIAIAIWWSPTQVHHTDWSLESNPPPNLSGALLTALVGVLWSFGGWHHATYLSGEAIHPSRTVPLAMLLGTMVVTLTYVLVNMAYLLLLPVEGIAGSIRVAGDAVGAVIPGGGRWVAAAIGISVFGTIAIYTMSAPRIYFAMARDGVFFSQLSKIHPKFHTPANAMLVQAVWAILLLFFWGTFSNLITYVTFMDIAFMAMAGFGVFLFRHRQPDRERPYRAFAYPLTPLVFSAISGVFVINTLIQQPLHALAGLAVVLVGMALYGWIKKQSQ